MSMIKNITFKVLDRLYIKPNKTMVKLIEETSLDGFKVVKIGDKVTTPLGIGKVSKIEKTSKEILYGVTLDIYKDFYKKNSTVYFKGSKLSLA